MRARTCVRCVCCSWISCFLLRSLSAPSMRYIHRSLFLTASRVTRQRTWWGRLGRRREGDLCELTCLSAYVAAFPNTRRGICANRLIDLLSRDYWPARSALEGHLTHECKRGLFWELAVFTLFLIFLYFCNISPNRIFPLFPEVIFRDAFNRLPFNSI